MSRRFFNSRTNLTQHTMQEEKQNTETKKQEAIRLAYQLINIPFDGVDENGWKRIKASQFQSKYDLVDLLKITPYVYSIRPKSLSGIEYNNGWISMLSEDGLPQDDYLECFVKFRNNEKIESAIFRVTKGRGCFSCMGRFYDHEEISHYQPIKKPNLPIF